MERVRKREAKRACPHTVNTTLAKNSYIIAAIIINARSNNNCILDVVVGRWRVRVCTSVCVFVPTVSATVTTNPIIL